MKPSLLISGAYQLIESTRTRLFTLAMAPLLHSHGCRLSITPPLRFANLDKVSAGNHVTIHSGCWIQALRGGSRSTAPALRLGNYVAIGMNATISAAEEIIIEDHVFTARNVYISDHGHEFHDVDRSIALQGISECRPVIIGNGSWLGQNVVILPGARIGRHCVIGANAVVNSEIPDFCIAAGMPARVIRRYNFALHVWERVSS